MKYLDLIPPYNKHFGNQYAKKTTKTVKKDIRYCQKCGKEQEELFEIQFNSYNTIKVCRSCRDKHFNK